MATNKPYGDNHRHGSVRDRSSCHSRVNGNPDAFAVKTEEGMNYERFIDQKADKGTFKGVRKEK